MRDFYNIYIFPILSTSLGDYAFVTGETKKEMLTRGKDVNLPTLTKNARAQTMATHSGKTSDVTKTEKNKVCCVSLL